MAADRSAETSRSVGRAAAGAASVTARKGVRGETFASDFTRRSTMSAPDAVASTAGSPSAAAPPSSPAVGHEARWTDPVRYQDQTSSVTKGRNGASSRTTASMTRASAARADCASASGHCPSRLYARSLTSSR